ncbi:MAG: hypothetical protein AB8G18_17220 [Gammaproteobacteria bacterium]
MRNIFCTALCLVVLLGCKSTSTPTASPQVAAPLNANSVLQSKCDRACKKVVKNTYGIKTGIYGPHIMGALITQLNGKVNEGNLMQGIAVYNNSFSGKYNLEVPPGTQQIEMMANWQFSLQGREQIEFSTKAGTTYYLGHVLDLSGGGTNYRWAPVVVNLSTSTVVYPEGDLVWYNR